MLLAYLLLITGLTISAVAIYYSVVGLAAIFSAAMIPIIVMGGSLEIAKLVCASWLKANWNRVPRLMKVYMTAAVVILMLITSMGIFGFLSKAHSDQSLVSGDVQSKLAIYDEKIKTAKENIEANRKQLKQMDEAVDQVMARSTDEKGADKANAIRRSQQRDRASLAKDIEANQKLIATLNDEAAPIRAEVRKVEAEVGPIKYIAAFVYGDNPDANILEKAVTWVILIIVVVFDPLAVIMLLAAQMTFGWHNKGKDPLEENSEPDSPPTFNEIPDWELPQEPVVAQELAEIIPDAVVQEEPQKTFKVNDPGEHPNDHYDYEVVEKPKEEIVPTVIDVDFEDADNDVIIVKTEEEKPKAEEKPKKLIEIVNDDYVLIDGEQYFYNSIGGKDPDVKDSKTLVEKLLKTGEYYTITHTADGVILTDGSGKSSMHTLDERPGDYVSEPTYVQNEEQRAGGLWQRIQHTISEEEYIKKSEQNKKGTA